MLDLVLIFLIFFLWFLFKLFFSISSFKIRLVEDYASWFFYFFCVVISISWSKMLTQIDINLFYLFWNFLFWITSFNIRLLRIRLVIFFMRWNQSHDPGHRHEMLIWVDIVFFYLFLTPISFSILLFNISFIKDWASLLFLFAFYKDGSASQLR